MSFPVLSLLSGYLTLSLISSPAICVLTPNPNPNPMPAKQEIWTRTTSASRAGCSPGDGHHHSLPSLGILTSASHQGLSSHHEIQLGTRASKTPARSPRAAVWNLGTRQLQVLPRGEIQFKEALLLHRQRRNYIKRFGIKLQEFSLARFPNKEVHWSLQKLRTLNLRKHNSNLSRSYQGNTTALVLQFHHRGHFLGLKTRRPHSLTPGT